MEGRRSEKYVNSDTPVSRSRVNKNKYLYDELNSKIGYEEVSTVDESQIDLSSLNLKNPRREEYQKIKDYRNLFSDDSTKTQEEKKEYKPKNFDINLVLEEAKKNRKTVDELEKKRNLNDDEYNVLSNLNKKYLHKKDFSESDDEELKELINTITSKTLSEDIKKEEEKDLFSELLASTVDIKLESNLSTEDVSKLYSELKNYETSSNNEVDKDEKSETEELEDTFYTKSLELSKKDLMLDDEEETDKNKNGIKIALISLLLLFVLLIVIYFLFKHFGIVFN